MMQEAAASKGAMHMNPAASGRSWGDGGGRLSIHIIEDISFEQGFVRCECGTTVWRTDTLTTEDVWDMHRNRPDLVTERALNRDHLPQANQSEVEDFLELVRNPTYVYTDDEEGA